MGYCQLPTPSQRDINLVKLASCVFFITTWRGTFGTQVYATNSLRSDPANNAEVGPKCTAGGYGPGVCTTASVCAAWFPTITSDVSFKCPMSNGQDGFCCPKDNPTLLRNRIPTFAEPSLRSSNVEIRSEDVAWAGQEGLRELQNLETMERKWISQGFVVPKGSPSSYHAAFFKSRPETVAQGRSGYAAIVATRSLAEKYKLSALDAAWGLREINVREGGVGVSCYDPISCNPYARYRAIDGSCNNLKNPNWGKFNTPMTRLLPPAYEDGIWKPKTTAMSGRALPSPRYVSSQMEPSRDNRMRGVTLLTMLFGQFVDHDMTLGAIFEAVNGQTIGCCDVNGQYVREVQPHPGCFPIPVMPDDPFYSRFGVRCMNFIRSLPYEKQGCSFGWVQQVNQLTSYLDGSMIYGSTMDDEVRLRGVGGKMRVTVVAGLKEPLPPQNRFGFDDACTDASKNEYCFIAGDNRVNEQLVMPMLHAIFLREHNRIVDNLRYLNPHWDDERLYQETKRIITALIEHITYNEWLSLILGQKASYEYGITPLTQGYRYDYDDTINPSTTGEFSIAFRFGHSLVEGWYDIVDQNMRKTSEVPMSSGFNNPLLLYRPNYAEGLMRGLLVENSQSFDSSFTAELQNHLFQKGNAPFGLDLVSLNVQRSRDWAIRPYNDYREFCNRTRARVFEDLLDVMTPEGMNRMRRIYESVDDIDLYIGAVHEQPAPGAVVGPTFQCIIADQFARVKKGDRFFYDLGNQPHSFSPAQLAEIRKITLSRIICNNMGDIRQIQPLAFYEPSEVNPIVPCDSYQIPSMDFSSWKESY